MQIQSNAAFYIVSFSGQEMFSEINFSLFLPLQNSNVVYLETFCANTVSGDGGALHLAAFSRNKENLCLFSVCPLAPLQTDSCTLQYNIVMWIAWHCNSGWQGLAGFRTAAKSFRAFVERVFADFRDKNIVFTIAGKQTICGCQKTYTHTGTLPQTPL